MNTKIYYIIGGVAVLFIIYMLILQMAMKKRKQKQLDNFNNSHSGNALTEQQKRLLTFGAILFYYRGEKILNFTPENRLDQYIHGLSQQWEISNSDQAKETLNNLLNLERSSEFKPILELHSPDLEKIKKSIAKGLDIEISEVEKTTSAYAWDICRSVSLAKWCYWSGYLTESETWDIIQQASDIAKEHGKSWKDYTVSFLLGRTIQGFDLDDLIIECKQLLHSQNPSLRKVENIDVYAKYTFL